jgi:predicted CoA-substrate-specific enzyme activase
VYFAGIDIGSTMTKVAVINTSGEILSSLKGPTGAEHRRLAHEVFKESLERARLDLEGIRVVVATGYGRVNVPFADHQVTELTCHARGVYSLFPKVRTAIDIGGQDVKCMKIRDGRMVHFTMNDKCAAGTGRFLEMVAATLGIPLEAMGSIAERSTRKISISSLCSIFAQQEIVSSLSAGEAVEDILAGLYEAMVSRVAGLVRRLGVEAEVVLTGGVAQNKGIIKALKEALDCEVSVPGDPLLTGALGAALLGKDFFSEAAAAGWAIPAKARRLEAATFFGDFSQ